MKLFRVVASALVAAAAAAAATQIRSVSTIDDLAYDENNKLSKHVLVVTPSCQGVPVHNDRFDVVQVQIDDDAPPTASRSLHDDIFGASSTSSAADKCQAACLERGTDRSLAASVLPQRLYYESAETKSLKEWFGPHCEKVEICLINYARPDSTFTVHWLNPRDSFKPSPLNIQLHYGERHTKCFHSFIGHQLQVVDPGHGEGDQQEEIIGTVTVEYITIYSFGAGPPNPAKDTASQVKQIHSTLRNEWTRSERVTRTFSPLGFAKGRLPDDVFASVSAYTLPLALVCPYEFVCLSLFSF